MIRFIPFAIPSGSSPAVQTQTKSATITTNGGSVTVEPDSGFLLSSATVTADIPTEEKYLTVTENGNYTITPSSGKLMSKASVSVNVPTGGLEGGMVAVHDIPNGKILSTLITLSKLTADNALTATIALPEPLSGKLPDYIILVSDRHKKSSYNLAFKYSSKIEDGYGPNGGIYYNGSTNSWSAIASSSAIATASVNGTTLSIKGGNNANYKWPAGTVTVYVIYTSDDAT